MMPDMNTLFCRLHVHLISQSTHKNVPLLTTHLRPSQFVVTTKGTATEQNFFREAKSLISSKMKRLLPCS